MAMTPRRLTEIISGTILAFSFWLAVFAQERPAFSQEIQQFKQQERDFQRIQESIESQVVPLVSPITPNSPENLSGQLEPETKPRIKQIKVLGSTAFSQEELEAAIAPFRNQEATLENLLALRAAITRLYVENGYITSAAFLPNNQEISQGIIQIQIIEGQVEEIDVQGLERLKPNYVRERLRLATDVPLNVRRLEEALQLLQFDPLIKKISAELAAGSSPGLSILKTKVEEADTFTLQLGADNNRTPAVGSERRGIVLTEANLFGNGERIEASYFNSDGSNTFYWQYGFPVNAKNGTISLSYGMDFNEVIEESFNLLDLEAESRYYEISFRQPVVQTPFQELALGMTISHTESESSLGGIPFPLSRGADEQGQTRISAVRFFQEWSSRSEREVIILRSQFSLGLNVLGATVGREPDAQFFDWLFQGQYVRLLAPDTLLLIRGELQLASEPLLPDEQFRLGGFDSVRGYRQDLLLSDNGFFSSVEVRLPILRIPEWQAVLQVAPFIDYGVGWNNSDLPLEPNALASVGLGLRWQQGENFTASFYWGIPLVSVEGDKRTLQENGLYFNLRWFPF